ncbi:MAG TPA: ABC transporter permease [Candidatus Atribacteria bacterium]|nr:MAG: hypothetical protein DRH33_01200 [Candidatus Nealsonbacteria bacterium]HDK28121.1 ABC transporter permease [Candidatus Atribacteria bacterium]
MIQNKKNLITVFIVIFITFLLIYTKIPQFFNPINLISNVFVPGAISTLIALGMMVVMTGGGVDLSIGTIAGLSALVGVSITIISNNVILGIFFALFAGAIIGLFNGLLIGGMGLSPFVVTLGTTFVAGGLQYIVSSRVDIGGMGGTYLILPGSMEFLSSDLNIFLIFVGSCSIIFILFEKLTYGRQIKSVGENPIASRLSGVKTRYIAGSTYIISGVLAAIVGLLLASLQGVVRVGLGNDYLMDAFINPLLGMVIFGRFSILGVIVSAVVITAVLNICIILGMNLTLIQITKGVVLLGIIFIRGIQLQRQRRKFL